MSFAEILDDPWFYQRLDYLGFVRECELIFGENSVTAFEYNQDTVKTVSQIMGLSTEHDNPTPRKNNSFNTISSEILRVLNRYELSAKNKNKLMPLLHDLDTELKVHADKQSIQLVDERSRDTILTMPCCDMNEIRKLIKTDQITI